MAPSRRKGANKAVAAAAARRKWKVGDLVLAKVKGFPAWPATVSEPGKWGYPADKKKIVVQFFGGEQIAFCNPVDIEEFTEEKKLSLLGKRHGKGADFIRAVNEIVNCFEKLKKQDSGNKGIEETDISNENNSLESVVASRKDEAPVVKVGSLSTGTTNDLNSITEAAAADDAFENENMRNLVCTEIPASTPYLTRNRRDVTRSRNSGSTKRKPARRLRSSARIDSRLQNTTLPSVNNNRTSRRFCASASEDGSLRRSRRIVKSSDESDGQNIDPHAFIANDGIEESNSGLMSVNSDTLSIDYSSIVDSVSKPVGAGEPAAENNDGETELSDMLDFQNNNVIKKKRNSNRKRQNADTVDTAKLNIEASDAEQLKTVRVSPSFSEKRTQKQAEDDGDEHLPLVKRARVRMGKSSSTAVEEFPSVHKGEQVLEVPERHSVQSSEALSCKVDPQENQESIPVNKEPSISSFSHVRPANKPSFWETTKVFVDGEATLPPSKRLHRALEAMSANVAEDCQKVSNSSPAINVQSNGYCASSSLECYAMSEGKKDTNELGSGALGVPRNCDSPLSVPESCIVLEVGRSENGAETTGVISDCGKANTVDPELCTGSSEQEEGDDATKDSKIFPFVEVPAEINPIVEDNLRMETVNISEQLANLNCNAPCAVVSPTDHCMTGCTELKEAAKGSGPDILQMEADSTSILDIAVGLANIDTCNQPDDEGDAPKTEDLASIEHSLDSKIYEHVEETRPLSLNSKIIHPITPVKVLNSGHGHSFLHSTSVSYEHMGDKTVSATQSSSCLTDGPESVARASPPSSFICNISALDNKKSLINNSSYCRDVHIHLEKAKLAGKANSKSEALSSFEAVIKSLTRTKESIGRATRIAIDCAKFGFATKVVETLAHNLESESSLHKKVDLFFLVDSITQCSRGIKGDGGVYPSAIQALLPRLLLAAAPPGSSSHENHRQCLKVLKVWQERKILPEPVICHHIRELDALCSSYPTISSNRALRNERAFDDPVREMEGMLVDEYGSNSSIQLPGFCMSRMMGNNGAGSDSDGESFEAVTPEHNVDNHEGEENVSPAVKKHRHILEDVDGELEMEDVAPCFEDEIVSTCNFGGLDQGQIPHPQPKDVPLASAPVSRSPLPPPPPPPPPHPHPLPPSAFPPVLPNSVSNDPDSKPYSSSQNYNGNVWDPMNVDTVRHRVRENKEYEADVPRHMPGNDCFSNRPTSRYSGRASGSDQPSDGFGKSFHLRPPHPAPSNQFSYVQEQRQQTQRDAPPPSRPNRFHSCNSDNGNFYRDRDRNKCVQRDNIGVGWKPPYPSSISGPCYPDGSRMANAPMSYGPPREPPGPHYRWNYPSRPMNHRHFNPYRPPFEGPIPVANRGPNYWRPR